MIPSALVQRALDWSHTNWFVLYSLGGDVIIFFIISPTLAGLVPYKLVCSLLARWWRHDSFSISSARVGLVSCKIVQHLLVIRWRHDFYSIGPLPSRLAIQNRFNICSLGGDVMISTALVHSGIDWLYKISSTFARKVATWWFLQHWSTPV